MHEAARRRPKPLRLAPLEKDAVVRGGEGRRRRTAPRRRGRRLESVDQLAEVGRSTGALRVVRLVERDRR